jgi:hypothetical protein
MERLRDALVAAEEARAAPLDAAASGALNATSGALNATSGALYSTSGALDSTSGFSRRWLVTRHPVLADVLMVEGGQHAAAVDYAAACGKEVRRTTQEGEARGGGVGGQGVWGQCSWRLLRCRVNQVRRGTDMLFCGGPGAGGGGSQVRRGGASRRRGGCAWVSDPPFASPPLAHC